MLLGGNCGYIRESPQAGAAPPRARRLHTDGARARMRDRCAHDHDHHFHRSHQPFSELSKEDVAYAGGKGANLGELTAAGLPVPPGFVVGAPAYALFCTESGVRAQLDEILAGVDVEDGRALEAAATASRQAVLDAAMPDALREAIVAAYAELVGDDGDAPVAVRSSATAEDTASASFAGMNETFLNVRGDDAVVDAVKRCWGSLFGARTIYYRGQRGFSQADMDIAVVVQRQIPSTRAGVMFTVDPSTGERDHLVIEGSFGLGEAVVSGSVSPDRYVVRKGDMAITTRSVRPKELVIEPAEGGGTRHARAQRRREHAGRPRRRRGHPPRRARPRDRGALRQPAGHRVVVRPRRRRVDAAEPPDHDDRRARARPRARCWCAGSAPPPAAPAAPCDCSRIPTTRAPSTTARCSSRT